MCWLSDCRLYCCCWNKTITFSAVYKAPACGVCSTRPTRAHGVYRCKERTVAGDRLTLLRKFLGRVWCSSVILWSLIRSELVNILWLIKRACSACSVSVSPSQSGSRAALFTPVLSLQAPALFHHSSEGGCKDSYKTKNPWKKLEYVSDFGHKENNALNL